MKLKTACTAFAIAMAACVANPSTVVADELLPTQQQMLPIQDQIAQLASDIEAELYPCVELSERIDALVERIDEMLNGEPVNKAELISQRRMALDLRKMLKCDLSEDVDNGEMLVGTGGGASCNCNGGGGAGGGIFGGQILGGGSGGGGAAGGGAGGFGSIAGLAGLGAAIAIPIAVSNDGGGSPASPSSNPAP